MIHVFRLITSFIWEINAKIQIALSPTLKGMAIVEDTTG